MKKLKNNKKGFTLIELLAVIVVLAIIALIVTPIILNSINKSRRNAAIDSVYGYVEAIEYQNQLAQLDPDKYAAVTSGDVSGINVKIKGSKPDSGTVTIEKNQVVSATLCINGYKTIYQNSIVTIADDSSECRSGSSNSNGNSNNNDNNDNDSTEPNENPKGLDVELKEIDGEKQVCIKINNEDECFKHSDPTSETPRLTELFGEENCQTNGMGPGQSITSCQNDDYSCYIMTTKTVFCIAKISEAPQCTSSDYASSCSRKYKATFKNGNTTVATIQKSENELLGTLPTEGITVPSGYVLLWYTEPNGGGVRISSSTSMPGHNITYYANIEPKTICKRAKRLHTEECTWAESMSANDQRGFCDRIGGYYEGENPFPAAFAPPKGTTTITYGNLKTTGLKSGDAFDCDVNGDGEYDDNFERFYYVSDLYKSGSYTNQTIDSNYAVLIYYNGYDSSNEFPSSYKDTAYGDDTLHGPIDVLESSLPTTTQWSNVSLTSTSRAIYNENGNSTSNSELLPGADASHPKFSYAGYAARLITYQELHNGCYDGTNSIESYAQGLSKCEFLYENTKFADKYSNIYSQWLETPQEVGPTYPRIFQMAYYGYVSSNTPNYSNQMSVHPVIEVAKTDMEI